MILSGDQYYQALLTRDARFDGRFFVAVKSTRIYCRPICRVKTPLRKNCAFYSHAAAAEVAGYRPCKRSRPELAPGSSAMEVRSELARAALACIHEDFLAEHSLEELAAKLGVTDRHMRQVFQHEFGVSPVEYWQTQRLLLTKQLLTDTWMPVTSVALASGFRSLRRFNVALKERYRMTPTELRKTSRGRAMEKSAAFPFRLAYRPPLDWDQLLQFLSRRAIPGVEAVANGAYCRIVRIMRQQHTYTGYLEATHDAASRTISVRLSDALIPVCAPILHRAKRLFDLQTDPAAINAVLGELSRGRPGLRLPGAFEEFELVIRAILGQQISVAGARTIAGRFAARFGDSITTPLPGLTTVFPNPARIARARLNDICALGIPGKRGETILFLARAMAAGELQLGPGSRIEPTMRQLRAIPGVGEWTAQYIAMRALSWPDAFPHTDLGVIKALGEKNPKKVLALSESWRPWRAYAVLHLWAQLEKKS